MGCGDVGRRVLAAVSAGVRVLALATSADRADELRSLGVTPLRGNLDESASLHRLAGLASHVLHLAPPPSQGWTDTRTANLLRSLRRRTPPQVVVYGSTSGVYGDCQGQKIDETRMPHPGTPRGLRRADAEARLRAFGRSARVRVSTLRIPGIYASDRMGGTPRERLLRGTPVLQPADDVYTNHIHADDLARAGVAAMWRGRPQRVYHACDDSEMKMGDYFDVAADLYGLPRPPRVPRATAQGELPLMLLSFMGESRRLTNTRLKRELRLRLKHPTVHSGLV